jgi:hypothetical protein
VVVDEYASRNNELLNPRVMVRDERTNHLKLFAACNHVGGGDVLLLLKMIMPDAQSIGMFSAGKARGVTSTAKSRQLSRIFQLIRRTLFL